MSKTKKDSGQKFVYLLLGCVIVLALIIFYSNKNKIQNQNNQNQSNVNRQNCLAEDCLLVEDLEYPAGELPQEVQDALGKAIDDEYKAYSTYEAVIKKFGVIRPFSMIIRAEEQHISLLKAVYDKYGLNVPRNNWSSSKLPNFGTIQQACQTGVEAEIANAALYKEELLPIVADYSDITAVFETLSNASEQKHLPAFEKCQ